jgi:hypothetical protein
MQGGFLERLEGLFTLREYKARLFEYKGVAILGRLFYLNERRLCEQFAKLGGEAIIRP